MDKILKQKAMYYELWQLVQKDTGEFAVGYWDNNPPSSMRFCGRSFKTLKEAEDYFRLKVESVTWSNLDEVVLACLKLD